MHPDKSIASFLKHLRQSHTLVTMVTVLLIVFSIPLTLIVLKEEQDIRQEAAKKNEKVISIDATPLPKEKYVPGRISVKFKSGRGASTQSVSVLEDRIRSRFDAQITRHDDLDLSEILVERGKEEQTVAELRRNPNVESAQRSVIVYALGEPNDTNFSKQYGMSLIQAPAAWDVTEGSEDVIIAIVDSGIDENHPELKGKLAPGSKVFHSETDSVEDAHGHGTHVAGIAAAITNNSKGVAGVCPKCKILNVKVLDTKNSASGKPEGSDINAAKGIRYATDQGAKVLNMSFAFQEDNSVVREAIEYAHSKGVVLVGGAGNNGNSGKLWPAAYDQEVIAVGAVGQNDKKASFSNYGNYVDVAAPGDNIWSTYINSQYSNMSGTSMAAPHVAGLAGLLASEGLSGQQIRSKIESTADDTPGTGRDWQKGRINAARALGAEVRDPEPTSPPNNDDDDKNDKNPPKNPDPDPCQNPPANKKNTPDRNNTKNNNNRIGSTIRERINAVRQQVFRRVQNIRAQLGVGRSVSVQSNDCDRESPIDRIRRDSSGRSRTPDRQDSDRGEREISIVTPGESRVVTIHIREETPGTIRIGDKEYTTDEYNELFGDDSDEDSEISSVSIIEYNDIMDCYSDNTDSENCDASKKARADLNRDGVVNAVDYNIFLRQMSAQK